MASIGSARSPVALDRDGYPCKSDGFADKLVLPSPCGSQEQTPPIYRGPGVGKGLVYDTMEGKPWSDVYEHTIFFKGDRFTVREDMSLSLSTLSEKKKLMGPPLDKRIRNVLDPEYEDFLECLKNKQCPTVFSKERDGLHTIQLFGLRDDEDLEEPVIPDDDDFDIWYEVLDGMCI